METQSLQNRRKTSTISYKRRPLVLRSLIGHLSIQKTPKQIYSLKKHLIINTSEPRARHSVRISLSVKLSIQKSANKYLFLSQKKKKHLKINTSKSRTRHSRKPNLSVRKIINSEMYKQISSSPAKKKEKKHRKMNASNSRSRDSIERNLRVRVIPEIKSLRL